MKTETERMEELEARVARCEKILAAIVTLKSPHALPPDEFHGAVAVINEAYEALAGKVENGS